MFKLLRRLFSGVESKADRAPAAMTVVGLPPDEVTIEGVSQFSIAPHTTRHWGFPILDWQAIKSWIGTIESVDLRATAWAECQCAWLLRFRDALGPGFRLDETDVASVVSSLDPESAQAILNFMWRTRNRIVTILEGIAHAPQWGKDILIVFDDDRAYYRYVSHYYPQRGQFSFSGGMFINKGCGHFVTVKNDLSPMERTIAHEMTHACLSHLPLPAWLDEGIAVNMDQRLIGPRSELYSPDEMWAKRRKFWSTKEIKGFWSGKSLYRIGDSNFLFYDLARMMVEQMAKDWASFKQFVLAANFKDSGASAAREHMGINLGEFVSTLLGKPRSEKWLPSGSQSGLAHHNVTSCD